MSGIFGFRPLLEILISKYLWNGFWWLRLTVSVPSRRSLYPNWLGKLFEILSAIRFPSPLEDPYIKIEMRAIKAHIYEFPSPLGDPYIQIMNPFTIDGIPDVFPSPLGDPYIQMKYEYLTSIVNLFPSPLGDPYIQIIKSLDLGNYKAVSVPSRRSLYPNNSHD